MKSVHEGDTLVVWKLDRLGRSARQLIDTVDALRERGAAFRSLTDALDTTTPRGRLVFHIFGGGRGYARRSEPSGRGCCRFTLIGETGRVRHFSALPETRHFFGASKLGLEAHFCTLKMGLIDRSIDYSVKRCRPAWSIGMIRRCLKWAGAPLCSGICCDNHRHRNLEARNRKGGRFRLTALQNSHSN